MENKTTYINLIEVLKNWKPNPILEALVKLIEFEFEVSKEKAEELLNKASEYNINSSSECLALIEDEFGYVPLWKNKKQ